MLVELINQNNQAVVDSLELSLLPQKSFLNENVLKKLISSKTF